MRLIDADALYEVIEKINPVDYGGYGSYEAHQGARDVRWDVLEIIDNQPTISQWISVSERLPQASKHILFSVKGKSYTSYGFHNDGIWTDINGAWYTDKEVNAWMPLPEPYKESEEE